VTRIWQVFTALASLCLACCSSPEGSTPANDSRYPWNSGKLSSNGAGRLRDRPCPFEVPPGQRVLCGTLRVMEEELGSPEVALAVAVFEGRSSAPSLPVVYVNGGPGLSALAEVGGLFGAFEPILAEHDLVVFDQRGCGHSEPELDCPDLAASGVIQGESQVPALAPALQDCRRRLTSQGIDLSKFDVRANAADIDDLRAALGYSRWHVLGVSFGTRLALEVARAFPDGVESLVLDSVQPPDVDPTATRAANVERSMRALLAACAAQHGCARDYPGLESTFDATLSRLDSSPQTLTLDDGNPLVVDANIILQILFAVARSSEKLPYFPSVIMDFAKGDFDLVRRAFQRSSEQKLALGTYLSSMCRDLAPFSSKAAVESANQGVSSPFVSAFGDPALFALCEIWDIAPAPSPLPVAGATRTLVLAGAYDPITPPEWGLSVAGELSNAQYVSIGAASHATITTSCGAELAAAFMRTSEAALRDACIDPAQNVAFVPPESASL